MSVIVKDMKMPESCAECCFLSYDDYATGHEYECTALSEFMDEDELPEGRRDDCPLVELIRCKDCAHYDISENGVNGICRKLIAPFDSYEWCSRAEPKEK